jgi:hypothetical protein
VSEKIDAYGVIGDLATAALVSDKGKPALAMPARFRFPGVFRELDRHN